MKPDRPLTKDSLVKRNLYTQSALFNAIMPSCKFVLTPFRLFPTPYASFLCFLYHVIPFAHPPPSQVQLNPFFTVSRVSLLHCSLSACLPLLCTWLCSMPFLSVQCPTPSASLFHLPYMLSLPSFPHSTVFRPLWLGLHAFRLRRRGTNGRPSLSDAEVLAVSQYILDQAAAGWPAGAVTPGGAPP